MECKNCKEYWEEVGKIPENIGKKNEKKETKQCSLFDEV